MKAHSKRSWITTYIRRVPLLENRVMKALADNNLRTAEVSLFNGENGGPRSIPARERVATDNRADSKLK